MFFFFSRNVFSALRFHRFFRPEKGDGSHPGEIRANRQRHIQRPDPTGKGRHYISGKGEQSNRRFRLPYARVLIYEFNIRTVCMNILLWRAHFFFFSPHFFRYFFRSPVIYVTPSLRKSSRSFNCSNRRARALWQYSETRKYFKTGIRNVSYCARARVHETTGRIKYAKTNERKCKFYTFSVPDEFCTRKTIETHDGPE